MSATCTRAVCRLALGLALLVLAGCAHLVVLHDPLDASEHNDLGVVYERSGQTALAEHEYRHALRLRPRQSRTWVNLGNLHASQGRWPAAERAYRRALRDSSTDTDAMNNLAIALVREGRLHEEAHAWALRAVTAGGAHDSLYRSTLAEVDRTTR